MKRVVLASDVHLSPARPGTTESFLRFLRERVAGADRLCVLGDLFDFWVGRRQLGVPELEPVWDALTALSAAGTEVVLFHGNRDFLLGGPEAARCGGRVTGEEEEQELFGRRVLLLHGDSLCTLDVDYQKSKRLLRSWIPRFLSWALPRPAAFALARRVRKTSSDSVSRKSPEEMDLVGDAVRARYGEGIDAMVCGHVHEIGRAS
ncbi:MAG: UDP-2,3-diacylglucosamine diphosphatase, partial [Planctomycetota bacterium JB042]